LVFRFLQNNDTGPRFLARYGIGRTKVAAAMLMTLPGIPGLYTGEEVGAGYEPYKQATPIAWDDIHELRPWYRKLIALRNEYPALRSRDMRLLDFADDKQILAYVRTAEVAADTVLVVLNYGTAQTQVALAPDIVEQLDTRTLVDLLSGEQFATDRPIAVAGEGVRVLKPQ
jgi:glycosidase